jgi:poly(3-hydroxybutyrate) depolymerase
MNMRVCLAASSWIAASFVGCAHEVLSPDSTSSGSENGSGATSGITESGTSNSAGTGGSGLASASGGGSSGSSPTGGSGAMSSGSAGSASGADNDGGIDGPAMPVIDASPGPDVSQGDGGAVGSAGCGMMPTDPLGQFVFNKTIMVGGVARKYSLRLPAGYDRNKPYRTIFSHHGCGSHNDQLINIHTATGFDAIVIAPEQISGNCFDDQSNMSKDLPVFDALVQWAEANLCVDTARIFSIGFSSGSWMTNILGCQRADVIRAKANVSGGLTMAIRPAIDCKGNVAGIFLHDSSDTQNSIAGGMYARGVLLQENGCAMTSKPYTNVPANTAGLCVQYDGCKPGFPVVWCQTSGINHDPQQTRSPNLFWGFLSQF